MLEEHLPDESWTFVRNPHYWRDGLPNADRIVVRIIPEEAALLAALRDGSIDIALVDSVDALSLLVDIPNVEVVGQEVAQTYNLYLNTVNPDTVFSDARVRQAVNLALNRQQLGDLALAGYARPGVPAAFSEPCDISQIPLAQYNPDRAPRVA